MLIRGSCPSCGHDLRVSVLNKTIHLDKRPEGATVSKDTFCKWCGWDLSLGDFAYAAKHLTNHLQQIREMAPEVEHDPQDGCEHLAPWTKQDFTKNS